VPGLDRFAGVGVVSDLDRFAAIARAPSSLIESASESQTSTS
jgi:hypothetical protein